MDSEHRHELQENDLRESLSNWREAWSKYGTPITVALLLFAIVFGGYRLYDMYTSSKREAAWRELAETSSPEGLARVAEQHSVTPVRMLALLRAADLHLEQAIFVAEPATAEGDDAPNAAGTANDAEEEIADDTADDPADADESAVRAVRPAETQEQQQRLERAETMYRRVLEEARGAAFRANAMLGLAAVAESREQWDAAADWYAQAKAAGEQSELPRIVTIADHRTGLLDRLRQPVDIVEAPEPDEPAGAGTGAGQGGFGEGPMDEVIDVPDLLEGAATEPATEPARTRREPADEPADESADESQVGAAEQDSTEEAVE